MTPNELDQQRSGQERSVGRRGFGLCRAAVVAAAVFGLLVAAGCSSGSNSTSTTSTVAGSGASKAITISNYKFDPATLSVGPGETVTVTNRDSVAHTVTSASGHFDTGDIQPGASTTVTAPRTAGRYPYICSIHQFMTGTLTVT